MRGWISGLPEDDSEATVDVVVEVDDAAIPNPLLVDTFTLGRCFFFLFMCSADGDGDGDGVLR